MKIFHTIVCAAVLGSFSLAGHAQGLTPEYSKSCGVPVGYDCASKGFERLLTLEEAVELSKLETVVYLYGPGIIDARIVADVISSPNDVDLKIVPAIAAPGRDVPRNSLYVVILGTVVRHKVSGEPIEFYQRFLNRGRIFSLTRQALEHIQSG